MLVYKIIVGDTFTLRETDHGLYQEIVNFTDCQEKGNKITIEVIDITREEFNKNARWDNI